MHDLGTFSIADGLRKLWVGHRLDSVPSGVLFSFTRVGVLVGSLPSVHTFVSRLLAAVICSVATRSDEKSLYRV